MEPNFIKKTTFSFTSVSLIGRREGSYGEASFCGSYFRGGIVIPSLGVSVSFLSFRESAMAVR